MPGMRGCDVHLIMEVMQLHSNISMTSILLNAVNPINGNISIPPHTPSSAKL